MIQYNVITSFNQTYWNDIAKSNIKLLDENWPSNNQIILYHELSKIDHEGLTDRVFWRNLYTECPSLVDFIHKWKDDLRANGKSEKKNAFRWNAIKFCHKTFAIWHAAKQQKTGWLIWLDCDAILLKSVDEDFLRKSCPSDKCISYLGRKGKYSECGFVAYNLDRLETQKFLKDWEDLYLSGEFVNLQETHDSWTFDYIRKSFDNPDLFCDLNADSITNKNPFSNSLIGTHMAHAKGSDKIKTTAKLQKNKIRNTDV
jgi:hypothetical protein